MFNEYNENERYTERTSDGTYGSYQYSSYTEPEPEKKPEKKKKGFLKALSVCIVLALVFGVVSAAAFQVTGYVGGKIHSAVSGPDQVVTDKDEMAEALGGNVQNETGGGEKSAATVYDVSAVADATIPSLVSITNQGVQEIQSFFGTYTQPSESSGSGIIVGKNETELLIATNNHVVENSEQLNVCFIDNQILSALVKGTDKANDLAVIAVKLSDIPKETMDKITIAELGDSDDLKIGEPVIAIGNALGYGQSVTTGVVSALNRKLNLENTTSSLIQTDAAINPGNSGGALLNVKGQVIGINSAKLASSQVEGMGYAIPVSTAKPIIDNLMNRETRAKVAEEDRGYLGISGVDVTEDISEQMGIPVGACVASVVDDSGAHKAGLQRGDVITRFDGIEVNSMTSLKDLLGYYKKGEKVEVVYKRADNGNYVEHTTELKLSGLEAVQTSEQESGR